MSSASVFFSEITEEETFIATVSVLKAPVLIDNCLLRWFACCVEWGIRKFFIKLCHRPVEEQVFLTTTYDIRIRIFHESHQEQVSCFIKTIPPPLPPELFFVFSHLVMTWVGCVDCCAVGIYRCDFVVNEGGGGDEKHVGGEGKRFWLPFRSNLRQPANAAVRLRSPCFWFRYHRRE